MRYTHILHLGFYVYAAAVVILFAIVGETHLVNVNTIALTVAMVVALSVVLIVPCRKSTELRIAFVSFAALFLLPAVPGYLLFPQWFPFGGEDWAQVAVEDVNRALVFVILGTLLAAAGFSFGAHVGSITPRSRRSVPENLPIFKVIGVGLLFVGLELYVGIRFGGFTTDIAASGSGVAYLTRLFSSDAFTIVALIVAAHRWRQLGRVSRVLLLATVILVVVHKTLVGARSSILIVLMLCLVILLDRYGDFHVSRRALAVLLIAALASVIVFPVATIVREYWLISGRVGYLIPPVEFLQNRDWGGAGHQFYVLLYSILHRLNGLDPIATIATGRSYDADRYVSLGNDVRSFINIIVPGAPFPGVIERSKSFAIVYRGFDERYLEKNYVTWMWTLWGDFYAMFGFVGGLAGMFVICALFAVGFALVARAQWRGSAFLRVAYLFFTYSLVVSFGLDTFGATAIYYLIPVYVVLTICGVFTPYLLWPFEQPAGVRHHRTVGRVSSPSRL